MEGDHIKARRMGLLYTHHGIDMGDGTVIHLLGDKLSGNTAVRRTSLEEFLEGRELRVVKYKKGKALPQEETLGLARKLLDKEPKYNLVFNNCEHFASYCKTGRKRSSQVKRALAAAGTLSMLIIGVGLRAMTRRV